MSRAPEESSPIREPVARVLPHHARAEWMVPGKPQAPRQIEGDELVSLALQLGVTEKAHKREAGTQMTTLAVCRATQMTTITNNTYTSVYDVVETSAEMHTSLESQRTSAEMMRPAHAQSTNSFTIATEHHHSSSFMQQTNDHGV
jgi:hypothetical protein